ncbi:MAG: diguanylate cyclase [Azoarcus sp.]|nr:diguanylate cyclase [Azoarcus sp.]
MAEHPPTPLSLKMVLIVPYVVLVVALALAVGILSYSAGSRAVATVSEHLLLETVGRIAQAVDRHIVGSGAVLESAFPDGMAAPTTIESEFHELRTRFWIATSLHIDPNNYVYYGNESGQGLGLYRHSVQDAELRMKMKSDEHRAIYRFSGIDGPLNFERRETRLFDPRTRPWYADGKRTPGHTWTSVYIDFGTRELVATRARRVLAASGAFEGVVATDVSLRALNDFVGTLEVSPNGIAFIIEQDGNLIASSTSPNMRSLPDGGNARLKATDSEHPLLRASYKLVQERLGAPDATALPRVLTFMTDEGDEIHVAFDRIKDNAGLEWITIVAMPTSDFMAGVTENVTRTVLLAAAAVALAILIGFRILAWVASDLRRISEAARKVGDGELDAPVGVQRSDEIGELARSFEAMQERLRTDKLTGLANRDAFLQRLRKRITLANNDRRSTLFGVLFIDLNRFKQVNDQYGHDAGDLALQEIAERLRDNVRAGDLVARYAGDEFVVLLDQVASRDAVGHIRRQIEEVLRQPLTAIESEGTEPISVGGAIGEALYPADGSDAESLLKSADRAMYVHKFAERSEHSDLPD